MGYFVKVAIAIFHQVPICQVVTLRDCFDDNPKSVIKHGGIYGIGAIISGWRLCVGWYTGGETGRTRGCTPYLGDGVG